MIERATQKTRSITLEIDAGQTHTGIECAPLDVGDAAGNRNFGQIRAVLERTISDAGYAIAYRDVSQACAVLKGIVLNVGDTVWNSVASRLASRTQNNLSLALVEQDTVYAAI